MEGARKFLADKINDVANLGVGVGVGDMEGARKFLADKINDVANLGVGAGVGEMKGARKFLADKINDVANLGVGVGVGDMEGVPQPQPQPQEESIGDFLLEKLHQLLHIFDDFWGFFSHILPSPETLHRWIHVGLTRVLPVALLLLLLCCCCCYGGPLLAVIGRCLFLPFRLLFQLLAFLGRCCLLPFRLLGRLLVHIGRCCGCCRRGFGKMMKAPGRGGALMPRPSFEVNPRGYFLNLRANKPLVY